MVEWRDGMWVEWTCLVTAKRSSTFALSVLREEEVLQLEVNLTPLLLKAGRYHGYDALPSYFIVGGVVFSNASFPLLQNRALMKSKSVNNEIIQSAIEVKQADCDLPIVLDVLSHEVNFGYSECKQVAFAIVQRFNGTPVRSLLHLATLVTAELTAPAEKRPVRGRGLCCPLLRLISSGTELRLPHSDRVAALSNAPGDQPRAAIPSHRSTSIPVVIPAGRST